MEVRRYAKEDESALRQLFKWRGAAGICDPAVDEIFAIGALGYPSGLLAYRAGAFVHELECSGLRRLTQARELTGTAIGHATAERHRLRSAIFLVRSENRAMLAYVESLGAVRQSDPGDLLYTLTP